MLRVLSDLERIGDLALRVVKLAPEQPVLASNPASFDIIQAMADRAVDRYRLALRAWATTDLGLATELATGPHSMDLFQERLMAELLQLEGAGAVRVGVRSFTVGQALDRIVDHSAVIGARLRYMITGDPDHLVAEVR